MYATHPMCRTSEHGCRFFGANQVFRRRFFHCPFIFSSACGSGEQSLVEVSDFFADRLTAENATRYDVADGIQRRLELNF